MNEPKKLVIVGAGGAAVEAMWVARRMNEAGQGSIWKVVGVADDNPSLTGGKLDDVEIVGTTLQAIARWRGAGMYFHCAVGNNRHRRRLAEVWAAAGFEAATLIDPTAIIASSASVDEGSYIGPLSIVAPHARIGRHVLINTHVGVGHHSVIGNYAQLCPGVRVNGGCRIDSEAFLGSNAVVHPGVSIGEGASIGASSFVIRSVKPHFTMLGVPARIMSRPAENGPDAQR